MKRYIRAASAAPFIYDGTQKVPKDVTEVIVADGVTKIIGHAFSDCTSLESISIPDSVTSIYPGAFENCTSLKSVTIPQQIKHIPSDLFLGCRSLESVLIPPGVESIGADAFRRCISLKSITLPKNLEIIYDWAFGSCKSLESIVIPENVTSIGDYAFYGCSDLESIVIPESVTSIGYWAFEGCSSRTIVGPDDVSDDDVSDDDDDNWFANRQSQLEDDEIDWDDIEDSFYQAFCDDAYQIVENAGFTDVFTEPSTQGGVGDDFFTAYSNGERYSGRYDFESEQETLREIYLEANSYEEACDKAAKWYAQVILDNLELDEE